MKLELIVAIFYAILFFLERSECSCKFLSFQVSKLCYNAFVTLFKQDSVGSVSLEVNCSSLPAHILHKKNFISQSFGVDFYFFIIVCVQDHNGYFVTLNAQAIFTLYRMALAGTKTIGSLRCPYGDGSKNVKKQLVKISKTTTTTFLCRHCTTTT